MDLTRRPRRLRGDGIRGLVSETTLSPRDLIAPVFVDATADQRRPIESMPGQERVPVDPPNVFKHHGETVVQTERVDRFGRCIVCGWRVDL